VIDVPNPRGIAPVGEPLWTLISGISPFVGGGNQECCSNRGSPPTVLRVYGNLKLTGVKRDVHIVNL